MAYLVIGLGFLTGSLIVVLAATIGGRIQDRRRFYREIEEEYFILCLSEEM
jgi:hypothetical protein